MEASTITAEQAREGVAASLAYTRTGIGEPLVLLHPLGANRQVWRPLFPYLTSEREVITLDLPGFGNSPELTGERPPTPSRLAVSVVKAIEALGFEDGAAHLAGNSIGGWVALEAAAAGHAASVTAIAPAGLWSAALLPKPQVARQIARAASPIIGPAMRSARLRQAALAGSIHRPERVTAAEATNLIRSYAQAPGMVAVNRAMRANRFERLADIQVPVTLAWCEYDKLIERPRTLPANVNEVWLRGCGHVPMWDDPQAVARALLQGSRARP
jgi:pimeloyl-ACP methyl ester carboxylesterase